MQCTDSMFETMLTCIKTAKNFPVRMALKGGGMSKNRSKQTLRYNLHLKETSRG